MRKLPDILSDLKEVGGNSLQLQRELFEYVFKANIPLFIVCIGNQVVASKLPISQEQTAIAIYVDKKEAKAVADEGLCTAEELAPLDFLAFLKRRMMLGDSYFVLNPGSDDLPIKTQLPLKIFNELFDGEYSEEYVNSISLISSISRNEDYKLSFVSEIGGIKVIDNPQAGGIPLDIQSLFFLKGDKVAVDTKDLKFTVPRKVLVETLKSLGVEQEKRAYVPPLEYSNNPLPVENVDKLTDLDMALPKSIAQEPEIKEDLPIAQGIQNVQEQTETKPVEASNADIEPEKRRNEARKELKKYLKKTKADYSASPLRRRLIFAFIGCILLMILIKGGGGILTDISFKSAMSKGDYGKALAIYTDKHLDEKKDVFVDVEIQKIIDSYAKGEISTERANQKLELLFLFKTVGAEQGKEDFAEIKSSRDRYTAAQGETEFSKKIELYKKLSPKDTYDKELALKDLNDNKAAYISYLENKISADPFNTEKDRELLLSLDQENQIAKEASEYVDKEQSKISPIRFSGIKIQKKNNAITFITPFTVNSSETVLKFEADFEFLDSAGNTLLADNGSTVFNGIYDGPYENGYSSTGNIGFQGIYEQNAEKISSCRLVKLTYTTASGKTTIIHPQALSDAVSE